MSVICGFSPGDEVIRFTSQRASQAELALVEAGDLTRKPEKVSWEAAGGLWRSLSPRSAAVGQPQAGAMRSTPVCRITGIRR